VLAGRAISLCQSEQRRAIRRIGHQGEAEEADRLDVLLPMERHIALRRQRLRRVGLGRASFDSHLLWRLRLGSAGFASLDGPSRGYGIGPRASAMGWGGFC
jgi:hypothetical protein